MRKVKLLPLVIGFLLVLLTVVAFTGETGPAGPLEALGEALAQAAPGDIQPESCVTCHGEAGEKHQASYDELYQDGVMSVTDLAYEYSAPDTHIVTFKMAKEGAPFDANFADAISIYFAPYTGTKFQFEPAAPRRSLKGDLPMMALAESQVPWSEKAPSTRAI